MHIYMSDSGNMYSLGFVRNGIYFACVGFDGKPLNPSGLGVRPITDSVYVTREFLYVISAHGDIGYQSVVQLKRLGNSQVEYTGGYPRLKRICGELFEYGQGELPLRIGGRPFGWDMPTNPQYQWAGNTVTQIGDVRIFYENGRVTSIGPVGIRYRPDGKVRSVGSDVLRYSANNQFVIGID